MTTAPSITIATTTADPATELIVAASTGIPDLTAPPAVIGTSPQSPTFRFRVPGWGVSCVIEFPTEQRWGDPCSLSEVVRVPNSFGRGGYRDAIPSDSASFRSTTAKVSETDDLLRETSTAS